MDNINIGDLQLSGGDFMDCSFSSTGTNYQIGFYVGNKFTPKNTFTDNKFTQIDKNNVGKLVYSTIRKVKSKQIFLFILLFIIIGNSSIYYYFETMSYKDVGVFSIAIKLAYHCVGLLFMMKMLQYMYYTCHQSTCFNSYLEGYWSYIIDPLSSDTSVLNIIPVHSNDIQNLKKILTNPDLTDADVQSNLTEDAITSSTSKEKTALFGVEWVAFVLRCIVIYFICFRVTLTGVPIYGVLYYYNPLAWLNMSGFVDIFKHMWKLDKSKCNKKNDEDATNPAILEGETKHATNPANLDGKHERATTTANLDGKPERTVVGGNGNKPDNNKSNPGSTNGTNNSSHPRTDYIKSNAIYLNDTFFRTFIGLKDHLVFDAFRLRSIKVFKNKNPLNVFFQAMYIYNSGVYFLNPITVLVLLCGLGYVPSTPSYFINGSPVVDAMHKRIILPFYKEWMFYFTQGRCFKTNLLYGVIRRFCTLGLDTWTTDAIFNNDKLKLVCNSNKYFIYAFTMSIIVFFLQTTPIINILSSPTNSVLIIISIISLVINSIYMGYICYKYNTSTDGPYTMFNDISEGQGTGGNVVNVEKTTERINILFDAYKGDDPWWIYRFLRNRFTKNRSISTESSTKSSRSIYIKFAWDTMYSMRTCNDSSQYNKLSLFISILLISIIIMISTSNINNNAKGVIIGLIIVFMITTSYQYILVSKKQKEMNTKVNELQNIMNRPKIDNKIKKSIAILITKLKLSTLNHKIYDKLDKIRDKLSENVKPDNETHKNINETHKNINDTIQDLTEHHTDELHDTDTSFHDITNSINKRTNLFMTLLLKNVQSWAVKRAECQITNPYNPSNKTTVLPDEIDFLSPMGNLINDSRAESNIETNTSASLHTTEKPQLVKGQKYSDWTQFFIGGSDYENQSLFITQFKCGGSGKNESGTKQGNHQKNVCSKLDKKGENTTTGIISIDINDIDTMLNINESSLTANELCRRLYRNKPRCLTVTKFHREYKTNSSTEQILELEVTNGCTGDQNHITQIDDEKFIYDKTLYRYTTDETQTDYKKQPQPQPQHHTNNDESSLGHHLHILKKSSTRREIHDAIRQINNTLIKDVQLTEKLKNKIIQLTRQLLNTNSISTSMNAKLSNIETQLPESYTTTPIVGGYKQPRHDQNAFNYRRDLRSSGKEYFSPIQYLDIKEKRQYKINDIQIDPINNKIKIFGINKTFDYTHDKIQEIVGAYLDERKTEELATQKIEQSDDMKSKMSYNDYVKYNNTKHINDDVANETAHRYMAVGGNSSGFKERFRSKFEETIQGQNIIETLIRDKKNKVAPTKYSDIMKIGGNPVIIKNGKKERYITSSGVLLPIKDPDTSKEYVDIITLNDEPMKITSNGKECYMTHDGSLINLRQNKNIYTRKKTFKKKRR